MARRIESCFVDGPAGRLEALLEAPDPGPAAGAALVCHPHPLYGGTLHNKVVYRMARALRRAGCAVLRINFRGVGRSEGEHAHLEGEIEDAAASAAWLRERYPDIPLTLAGFSFGARAVSRLGCRAEGARRLILAGFPVRMGGTEYLETCPISKVFIQSAADEFSPRPDFEAMYARAFDPKKLVWIPAGDHFFAGGLDAFEEAVYQAGA